MISRIDIPDAHCIYDFGSETELCSLEDFLTGGYGPQVKDGDGIGDRCACPIFSAKHPCWRAS